MGLRTWVKRRFGKKDVQPMSYALRPDPFAQIPQTIDRVFDDQKNEWSPVEEPAGNLIELAEQWFDSGLQKYMQGDMLGATQDWEKAIEIKPDDHKAWNNRGLSLNDLGRKEEAIASYEKAIEIKPDYHEAWYNRGLSLSALGRKEEAIASYEKAIEFKPDLYEAWNNRGLSLDDLGRKEEAIASYEKAIEIKPDYHEAWYNRGNSLFALGRKEEAIASYEKAIEIKPDYHAAWNNRGLSLDDLGRKEEAIASYEKAIEFKPDLYAAWSNRGIAASSSRSSSPYALPIILNQRPANLHHKHPELSQRGYEGQVASLTVGLTYCPAETHPLGHGFLQRELGDTHFKAKQFSKAFKAYQIALTVLTESDFPEERLLTLQQIIRLALTQNNLPAARHYQTQGTPLYETLRTQAQNKRTFEAKFSTFRLTEIDLLIGENEPTRALQQAEFYKTRALTWLLDPQPNRPPAPNSGGADPKNLVQSPPELGDLGGERINNENRWQSLSDRESIVYWHQSTDRITTFILTNDNAEPIVLDCDRQQQHKHFTAWKDKWDKDYDDYRSKKSETQSDHPWRQQMRDRLKQLAEILEIDAIEQHLKNTETLILIPHRDLHRYPIHALFDRPTTHAPSLQSIDRVSHPAPSSDRPFLLLIDDPDRSSRLPDHRPMPFAQIESAIIQQLIEPNATHINHTNATHNTILQQLTQQNHRYFHFIGHAEHDFQTPENSALDLCDRPLTAKTIANLNLSHLHLATLSSCETSIVSTENHTEYLGLTSAFLCAGTQTILSTLWQVEEIASAWFMIHFHQLIKTGLSPAIALTHTQTWMQTVTWQEFTHWLEELRQLPGLPSFPIDRLESRIQNILQNGDTIDPNQPTEYCHPIHWAAFILTGQG
ncbi:MAG: CHAT domain-containing tetratricopeptide repeat protein [Cyanobacteria bacterium]|nr:CHAT domain-containing tetratricopeptide repeat protein [Cyanobacteriota bacterium]